MTDEKDGAVHYQVSVTGRQAAAFFLVLLAALGLSFFFGMKTGAAAKRGPDSVSALAAQSDIPVPTEAAGAEGEGKSAAVPTEVPIGFGPASEKPAKAEPPAKEERAPVVKELAAEPTPSARKESTTAAPAKGTETAKTAEEAKEEGPFWVQILVTSSAQKADGLAKKLKAEGFRPDVSVVPGKKGLFRVRIGSYPDRPKAEAAAKKVEKVEKLQGKPLVVPGK